MSDARVLLDVKDGIATMTLNHPDALNAFGHKLKQDMGAALDQLDKAIADRSARVLVITGAGRGFSSGANLNDPDKPPRDRAAEARGEAKSDLEDFYNPACRSRPSPRSTALPPVSA